MRTEASRRGGRPRTRVIVTGSEYPAGLAAVRALDLAGFEVWAAVSERDALGARSRAPAGLVDVPDPRTDANGFVRALADAAQRLGAAAVLPGTEAAVLALADRDDAFPDGVALGSAPAAAVRRATDKVALALLSLRAGLDVPPTRILDADEAAGAGTRADGLSFPAIVKPLRSELIEGGELRRFEARRAESREQLEHALRALPDGIGLVQPYIEGRLMSVNGVAFEGRLHAANQHVVHRVWPDRCGQAVYAETVALPAERERQVAAFMAELGWSGVFNLQLIERDGRAYVIDLNPRFYVSLSLAVAAGLNLPAIWVALMLGLPFDDSGGYRAGVRYRQEKGDPRAIVAEVRRGQLATARDLLPHRGTVHALFSIRDPAPALSIASDAAAALRRRLSASR